MDGYILVFIELSVLIDVYERGGSTPYYLRMRLKNSFDVVIYLVSRY